MRSFLVVVTITTACTRSTAPRAERILGEALVAGGAEGCPIRLVINERSYQPVSLPSNLAVVGNRLLVEGTARDEFTTCMIGPVLTIRNAARIQ